ncbi:hypothetical protein OKW43_002817 [Paraburkholderia sp. WC7.3g]
METPEKGTTARVPWNKGRLTGQKPPLKLKEIWAIHIRLQLSARVRDLAMFNLRERPLLVAKRAWRDKYPGTLSGGHSPQAVIADAEA